MRRKLALITMIGALTLTAAAPPASAYEVIGTAHTEAVVTTTGSIDTAERDILGGLLFGIGDFAAEIGNEITQFRGITEAEYRAQTEAILDGFIAARGPELKPVLADLRSGEIHRVETGLTDLSQLYIDYLETVLKPDQYAAAVQGADPITTACGLAVVCVFYAAAAVHNTVVITGVAAVALAVWKACGVVNEQCATSGPYHLTRTRAETEYFVADVTRAARA